MKATGRSGFEGSTPTPVEYSQNTLACRRTLGTEDQVKAARLADGVLAILAEGGFSPDAAVVCFATLFTFMTGQIDLDAMSHFVVHGVSTATLDNVTSSARFSREELFELGYDAVMQGLKRKFLQP